MSLPLGRRQSLLAVLGAVMIAVSVAGGLWFRSGPDRFPERPPAQRPELLLLTSLPIVFPEQFAPGSGGSRALDALQRRYKVMLISIADRASLSGHRLLLMAQPRAQPAEVLVELDSWVRGGGHVLLLADPALQWPSERPLGDPLRPPLVFADIGLLAHWGLKLVAPAELTATAAGCSIARSRLVGRCTVGKGKVTVIADADFLDAEDKKTETFALLLSELDALEG